MNIVRTTTAARWLGISTSAINVYKRSGKVGDPGRGMVDYDEISAAVGGKRAPDDDLGPKSPTGKQKRALYDKAIEPSLPFAKRNQLFLVLP